MLRISDELAAHVYTAKKMLADVPESLIKAYAAKLVEALIEGISSKEYYLEDDKLLAALTQNVYQFAAAKSYTQMKSLTQALLDDQGKLRTWTQFRAAALEINNEQIMQWLQAEYTNAVACAQMASRWIDIQSRAETLPMLRYVTAGDERVRPAHAAMEGITLPVTHTFWLSFFPPNGWNCRCDVQQGSWEEVTPQDKLYYPDEKEVPNLFRFNPGETKMAFPSSHPYFTGLPHDVTQQANDLYKESKKKK